MQTDMNRREALSFLASAVATAGIVTQADAAWKPQSVFRLDLDKTPSRQQRYARYGKLATENDFVELRDDSIMLMATNFHLRLFQPGQPLCQYSHDDSLARIFSPYKIGCLISIAAIYGDVFVTDHNLTNDWQIVPADSIYRIETTKVRLLEYQQSLTGPSYEAATHPLGDQEAAVKYQVARFHPQAFVHLRHKVGKYNPYGTSALETGKPVIDKDFHMDMWDGIKELAKKFNWMSKSQ